VLLAIATILPLAISRTIRIADLDAADAGHANHDALSH
jgi:hypothetical protein